MTTQVVNGYVAPKPVRIDTQKDPVKRGKVAEIADRIANRLPPRPPRTEVAGRVLPRIEVASRALAAATPPLAEQIKQLALTDQSIARDYQRAKSADVVGK